MNLAKRARILWKLFTKGGMTKADTSILILAFLYCLSPVDIVPDIIPAFGFLDDLIVVLLSLRSITNKSTHTPADSTTDTADSAKEVDARIL